AQSGTTSRSLRRKADFGCTVGHGELCDRWPTVFVAVVGLVVVPGAPCFRLGRGRRKVLCDYAENPISILTSGNSTDCKVYQHSSSGECCSSQLRGPRGPAPSHNRNGELASEIGSGSLPLKTTTRSWSTGTSCRRASLSQSKPAGTSSPLD